MATISKQIDRFVQKTRNRNPQCRGRIELS